MFFRQFILTKEASENSIQTISMSFDQQPISPEHNLFAKPFPTNSPLQKATL